MHILMIAPEPFFEPRGTPFSEFYRIRALCALGHTVELVTYPIGSSPDIPGLTIRRCANPFRWNRISTGPSPRKAVLDVFLFFSALRYHLFRRHDLIHSHEEASWMVPFLRLLKRTPHLYDMHSSLVQQMDNFAWSGSRMIRGLFSFLERRALRSAQSIIVICKTLQEYAAGIIPPERITLIENFVDLSDEIHPEPDEVASFRKEWVPEGACLSVYTGTLETYQGIPLLLEALSLLPPRHHLLIAGGREEQIRTFRLDCERRGIAPRVHWLGQVAQDRIPLLLQAADILVSPRTRGTNIPLKIYQYLKSGKPVVATRLLTHTQTLTPDITFLPEPEPQAFAKAMEEAAGPQGVTIARKARTFCTEHYSRQRYHERVVQALNKTGVTAGPQR